MAEVSDALHNPTVTGALGVLGTALLGWLGQRMVGKAAIQEAINASFREVMDQLRRELKVALKERDEARAKNTEHEAHIEELQRTISVLEQRVYACEQRL